MTKNILFLILTGFIVSHLPLVSMADHNKRRSLEQNQLLSLRALADSDGRFKNKILRMDFSALKNISSKNETYAFALYPLSFPTPLIYKIQAVAQTGNYIGFRVSHLSSMEDVLDLQQKQILKCLPVRDVQPSVFSHNTLIFSHIPPGPAHNSPQKPSPLSGAAQADKSQLGQKPVSAPPVPLPFYTDKSQLGQKPVSTPPVPLPFYTDKSQLGQKPVSTPPVPLPFYIMPTDLDRSITHYRIILKQQQHNNILMREKTEDVLLRWGQKGARPVSQNDFENFMPHFKFCNEYLQ